MIAAIYPDEQDSWRGIGDVERGMARQGFDLQFTR
jgi:hypothetical protein